MDTGVAGFILGILSSVCISSMFYAAEQARVNQEVPSPLEEPVVWSEFESDALAYSVKTQVDGLQRSDTDCRTIQTVHALSVQCSNGLQVYIRDTRPEVDHDLETESEEAFDDK